MPSLPHSWRAALAATIPLKLLPAGMAHAQEAESAESDDVAARVGKLKTEIVALRIMVGALEAAVRAEPSFAPEDAASSGTDDLKAPVRALEVQIGALTNRLEKSTAKLDQMPAPKVSSAAEKAEEKSAKQPRAPEVKPAEEKRSANKTQTQYLRRRYQEAADSFLLSYRKYSGSDKAPDTVLRLGKSLAALGKTTAACFTFKELSDESLDAQAQVRRNAQRAAGKAGYQ